MCQLTSVVVLCVRIESAARTYEENSHTGRLKLKFKLERPCVPSQWVLDAICTGLMQYTLRLIAVARVYMGGNVQLHTSALFAIISSARD